MEIAVVGGADGIPAADRPHRLVQTDGGIRIDASFQLIALVLTGAIVGGWQLAERTVRVFHQDRNRGKGAAIRRGIEESRGDIVVVHDADLEYDPRDFLRMLPAILEGKSRVVYGSRFTGERRNMMFWHWVGNRFLSLVTNVLYNTTLSDMETCYKMIDGDLVRSLHLTANRFDIEPQVTAKILRTGQRIWEVPISYAGREIDEGKKISWRDGFPALWTLIRVRFLPRSRIYKSTR